LVPPVSQTRTGKGKANSLMAGHKRKTPRRWSSGDDAETSFNLKFLQLRNRERT
jgi:hypothetical protein